jgi:hypothetical protein
VSDFHSLRHTAGTLLGQTGAHPKTIQGLMRHSDINLTMGRYCHRAISLEANALAELPDFGTGPETGHEAEAVRATGPTMPRHPVHARAHARTKAEKGGLRRTQE